MYGMTKKPSKPALRKKKIAPHYFWCLHFLLCSLIQHFVDKYAKLLYSLNFLDQSWDIALHYFLKVCFSSKVQLYALLLPLLSCNLLCHYMMHKGNVLKVVWQHLWITDKLTLATTTIYSVYYALINIVVIQSTAQCWNVFPSENNHLTNCSPHRI